MLVPAVRFLIERHIIKQTANSLGLEIFVDSIRAAGSPAIAAQQNIGSTPAPAAESSSRPQINDGFSASRRDRTEQAIRDMRHLSATLGAHSANHASSAAPAPTANPAPSAAPAPTANPAPSAAPAPTGNPAPSAAPAPTANPAPSAAPAPTANPAPSATPAPTANPAPSAAPAPTGSPNPPAPPSPSGQQNRVEAPSLGEKAEIACGTFNVFGDGISSTAESVGISAAAGAIAGAAGFAAAGIGLTALGAVQFGKGIKEHDAEGAVGGSASFLDGVGNSASAVNIAAAESTAGQIAGKIAAPFSLASAVISTGLGVKELHDGIKNHSKIDIASGALNLALGVSNAASALGGGIPALIATGVIIVGKIALAAVKSHMARHQAGSPPTPPTPPAPPQTQTAGGPNPPIP